MNAICAAPVLVDHDGQAYLLVDLVRYLPTAYTQEASETMPRTAQAFWDEVVHRWPATADRVAVEVDQDWRGSPSLKD